MLTTELLARDWEQYAIVNYMSDITTPLKEKFKKCLGIRNGCAVFVIDGMDEQFEESLSRLVVGDDGYSCFDYVVADKPFHVGHFELLHIEPQ